MTSESRRRLLYDRVADAIGSDAAEVLMEHLPPAGWSELATQAELHRVEQALRTDLTRVESTLREEIGRVESTLRGEIEHLGTVIRSEMATLGAELRTEMATSMSGVDRRMVSQTRTLMMGMIGTVIATFSAAATFH